ncbi:porin [Alkalimarinus alittae]|uniref:Porin n=1 Tax=Alkalimarinus alittae TaxID=2961619 RepID=A0ABY6N0Z0_9ALTE|nr:porin [Alkalimarinus alittae]UZE95768.1 porin [Alkalimarinus alittae]
MKKTLIASAVAAAALSTSAFAEEYADKLDARLALMPTVYGNIQLAWAHTDMDPGNSETTGLVDNGSTIGFKHSHEISPGLTGFIKAELEFDADDKAGNGGLNAFDEAYIGVKGDFGKVWVGSDDSVYEQNIDYVVNFFEYAEYNIGGSYSTGEGDLVQYVSPSMGGFSAFGAVQINSNEVQGSAYPYQLGVSYAVDAVTVALAMDSNDGSTAYSKGAACVTAPDTVVLGVVVPGVETCSASDVNNENTYGLRIAYEMDNVMVSGEYQTRSDVQNQFGLIGVYTMGANQFALAYEWMESDAPGSKDEDSTVSLQALHNLSDNMYVYTEAYFSNKDDGTNDQDIAQLVLGATYVF